MATPPFTPDHRQVDPARNEGIPDQGDPSTSRTMRALAAVATGLVFASCIVLFIRFEWFQDLVLAANPDANVLAGPQSALLGLAWALCGLVVVWKTGNRVGWISIAVGVSFGLQWIGWAIWDLARSGEPVVGLPAVVGAFLESGWFPAMVLMAVVLPLVFPTGRMPSPRWRWVAVVAIVALLGVAVEISYGLVTDSYLEVFGDSVTTLVMLGLFLAGTVGGVASLFSRFRAAGTVERQQIKWVLAALGVSGVLVFLLFLNVMELVFGPKGPLLAFSTFGLIPLSITLAILRYRLFDIDRIVSRTVSYALVVGLLAAFFFATVTLLTSLLPAESDLTVAASTLAVAALFNPVRRRVQGWVDRRFDRARYDAQRVIDEFAGSVRDEVDPEKVVDGWVGAVTATMHPSLVGVWIKDSG